MATSSEIRQQFVDYFRSKRGHTFVPSSPVVPHDDPTLLFANAGMNQFKDVFLGTGKREFTRAVNSQKCIRAGGKHNDLEDVGKDTYHHTFFEMLGNWSFGDYFKREAIAWAWELLTDVWGLEKDRLHATVFAGDPGEDLERDEEAANLWRQMTDISHDHIHLGDKTDNFWEMGDTGPCGPCSEIHIDLTPDKSGAKHVNADHPQVIEIWNLVFIQYNRNSAGLLTPLPAKHVDTGMGFERIVAVLQGKASNYDTDVFTPLFDAIREVTGARPYGSKLDDAVDMAYRVIADHVRCLTFALTDGAMPSNEGRGYVLRRILRRAFRHGRQTLELKEPFLHRLVPAVVEQMGEAFPELGQKPDEVAEVIRDEEQSFNKTIDRGIALFDEAADRGGDRIRGEDAFMLYDTYGFPLDLTQVMAEERGMSVDVAGFNELMEKQRAQSRAGAGGGVDARQSLIEIVQKETDLPATAFDGYNDKMSDELDTPVRLLAHFENEGGYVRSDHLSLGQHGAVIVERTPFYPEAGGQVGDRGTIAIGDAVFRVEDTVRVGESVFHLGEVKKGKLKEAESAHVKLTVDEDRRRRIMAHHTTTHLLNLGLRHELGDHVLQRGSLVDDTRTRFDFSHNEPVSDDQLERVEQIVREQIEQDYPVHADELDQEKGRAINGLRAVFGEKYPPRVRVVSVGVPVDQLAADPDNDDWPRYSIEFCGGTHLARTGLAQDFVIVTEEAVAKGIRRVVGLAGEPAARARKEGERLLKELTALKSAGEDADDQRDRNDVSEFIGEVNDAVVPLHVRRKLSEGIAELQQMLKQRDKHRTAQQANSVVEQARELAEQADGTMIVARLDGADANAIRTAMDVIRKKRPDVPLLLAGVSDDKVALIAAVPEDQIKQGLKAGDWVREVAKVVGGGGGGRPDMAQAGGKEPAKVGEALERARAYAAATG